MSLLWGVYVGVPVCTILINGGLAYWIYTRHADVRGSRWFVAALLLIIGWMVAEIAHLGGLDPVLALAGLDTHQGRIVAMSLATKLAVVSFLANIVFYSLYSRSNFHRHVLTRVSMGVVLGITLMPAWIAPFRQLTYRSIAVAQDPFTYVVAEPAPIYAVVAILLAVMVTYALVQVVRYMLSTPRRSGFQLGLLVLGSLSIMTAIALGNADLLPLEGKTHAEFGALPASLLISLALFRFRLFEMQPVARNALVEDLRDPVLVVDPQRRIVDYNPASTAVWPAMTDSTGETIDDVCPDLADELVLSAEGTDETTQFSMVVDGTRRYYSLTVSVVSRGQSNGPRLYALLLRDVTDLEESRWLLARQNDRLEQVAATISHDLRNPINVADGYAEILAGQLSTDELDPDDRAQAREHLQTIDDAHDRMTEIIEDVLALAREGQAVEETEPVSLSAVAHDAWSHVATGDAMLTITDDRRFAADASKLQTLFENLFRNAVEHGGAGVTVTVGPLPGGFFVADDGPGIPESDAGDIFEYGYTTADDGTGLGLSIVRTIAESHGWSVELDGDASGARFVFSNVNADPTTTDTGGSDSGEPTLASKASDGTG